MYTIILSVCRFYPPLSFLSFSSLLFSLLSFLLFSEGCVGTLSTANSDKHVLTAVSYYHHLPIDNHLISDGSNAISLYSNDVISRL